MEWFQQTASYVHIVFGFMALGLFWVPVFARKGGDLHVRFGTWFKRCAYVVLATAGLGVVVRLGGALLQGIGPTDAPQEFAFIVFLGYLAWVTFVIVRHGVAVLRTKRNPASYATMFNRSLAYASIAASMFIIGYGVYYDPPVKILLFALSPIGILTGWGIHSYITNPPASKKAWFYEHMGSMLGAGIAFHTAFFVFGITRLIDIGLTGWVAVIPWILPTVIGVPVSEIWTRYYKRRFGDLPPKTATA